MTILRTWCVQVFVWLVAFLLACNPGGSLTASNESYSADNHPSTAPGFAEGPPPFSASVPSAPIGRLAGSPGVDDGGHATYTLPLEVPPGPAAMQPKVALTYNSGRGVGPVGVGFGLEATSSIRRCRKTDADDGVFGPVRFQDGDALCIDGERLFAVSGVHGASGTEYRTRNESFARVVQHGALGSLFAYFEVRAKDGKIHTYGRAPDARIRLNGQIYQWSLSRTEDRAGNFMVYRYASFEWVSNTGPYTFAVDADHRLERIEYAGNGQVQPLRSVRFEWLTSHVPTQNVAWLDGVPFRHSYLLTNVRMTAPGSSPFVRRYNLRYREDGVSKRPLLHQIAEADEHGVWKPATEFSWELGKLGVQDVPWMQESYDGRAFPPTDIDVDFTYSVDRLVVLDANGDGAQDLLFAKHTQPWVPSPVTDQVHAWRLWMAPGPNEEFDVSNYEVTTNVGASATTSPSTCALTNQHASWAINLDNDGRDDLVSLAWWHGPQAMCPMAGATLSVLQNLGWMYNAGDPEQNDGHNGRIYVALFPDLNGDGLNDALLCRGVADYPPEEPNDQNDLPQWVYGLNVADATKAGGRGFDFENGGVETGVPCSRRDEYILLDRNGDRRTELLVVPFFDDEWGEIPDEDRTTYYALQLSFSTGSGSLVNAGLPRDRLQRWRGLGNIGAACSVSQASSAQALGGEGRSVDKVLDLNGDGLLDIVRFELQQGDSLADMPEILDIFTQSGGCDWSVAERGVFRPYYNTGRGFFRGTPLLFTTQRRQAIWAFGAATPTDYNADGRTDLVVPELTTDPMDSQRWLALLSLPEEFELVDTGIPHTYLTQYSSPSSSRGMQPNIDLNADGVHDILMWRGASGWDQWKNEAVHSDLLVGVTDGLQGRVSFEYALSNEDLVHLDANFSGPGVGVCNQPDGLTRCFDEIRPIVRRLLLDDGLDDGNSYAEEYEYWNGHTHRGGRGWLGFERIRVRQGSTSQMGTHAIVDRVFDNRTWSAELEDFPFSGRLRNVIVRQQLAVPDRAYMRQEQTEWVIHPNAQNPRVYATLPETVRSREWERSAVSPWCPVQYGWAFCDENIGSTADVIDLTTYAYDEYGGATQITRSVMRPGSGVDSIQSITTAFDNDSIAWLIGLPREVWVVDETPSLVPETRHVSFENDPVTGLLAGFTVAPAEPAFELVTTLERDARGNVILAVTEDASGDVRETTSSWDAEGIFLATRANPLGHTETYVYHPGLGVPTHHVDPNGVTHVRTYDGFGRLVESERRSSPLGPTDGATRTITYSKVDDGGGDYHLRVREHTAGGDDVTTDYDRLGRAAKVTWSGFGGAESYQTLAYDHFFRLFRVSIPTAITNPNPAGYHTYFYDVQDREVGIVSPDGTAVSYSYEGGSAGNTIRYSDAEGNTTVYVLDAQGRPRRIFDADATLTCYEYGAFDTLALVQRDCWGDELPAPITVEYDAYGRRTRLVDDALGERIFGVNAWGEVVVEQDANGQTIEYERDGLGRILTRIDEDGVSAWEWDTDKLGLLRRTVSAEGNQRVYSYDGFSRLAAKITRVGPLQQAFSVGYEYDALNRLATIEYPVPQAAPTVKVRRTYDSHGNLHELRDAVTDAVYWRVEDVDPAGRIQRESFLNGVTTQRDWDELSGSVQMIRSWGPQGVFQSLNYSWTDARNLHRRTDNVHAQQETFGYDALHRLKSSAVQKGGVLSVALSEYDRLGNFVHRSDVGHYDYAQARLVEAGGVVYSYDENGNVVLRGGDAIVYSALDKVKRISGSAVALENSYDADGERVLKQDFVGGEETVYVDDLYERVTGTGGPLALVHKYYLHGGGRVVAQIERRPGLNGYSTEERYVHDDHLRSTDVVTDSQGAPVQRMSFDAWGRRRDPGDWTLATGFVDAVGMNRGFTGHPVELEGALVNMGGRMFDPYAGRFASADPVVVTLFDAAALNRYSYVHNNPLRYVDPTGYTLAPPDDSPPTPFGWCVVCPFTDGTKASGKGPTGGGEGMAPAPSGSSNAQGADAASSPSDRGPGASAPASSGAEEWDFWMKHYVAPFSEGFIEVFDPYPELQEEPAGEVLPVDVASRRELSARKTGARAAHVVGFSWRQLRWVFGVLKGVNGIRGGAPRNTKRLSQKEKDAVRDKNRAEHGGKLTCVNCKRDDLVDPVKRVGGQETPSNEGHVDHIKPRDAGGSNDPSNLQVLCPSCNNTKRNTYKEHK